MVKSRRGFLLAGVLLACGWSAPETNAAPRPLVLVFPGGQATGPSVSNTQESDDKMAPPERSLAAARAVVDCFKMNGGVEPILYSPESPSFLRAAQEAKVVLNHRVDLSDQEQIAICRAAGAVYLVQIAAQKASDGNGYEVRLVGYTPAGQKKADRAGYVVSQTELRATQGDINAVTNRSGNRQAREQALQSAITSAANTLVARLMEGPLKDYSLADAPPGVVTPTFGPTAPVAPPIEEQDTKAEAVALSQAASLLEEKDTTRAIILLRRTVNRYPLSARARVALVRTYLAAKQNADALGEAKRGLLTADLTNPADRDALVGALQDAATQSGERGAARQVYQEIVADQPTATWARLALADLYLVQGDADAAERQYRAVRAQEPGNTQATAGLIKALGSKGDYTEAVALLAPSTGTPDAQKARYQAAATLFDSAAPALASLLTDNRAAWEAKRLSREAFYRATAAQAQRAGALVTLLRSTAPPPGDVTAQKSYSKRVLAASLLAQATSALQSFLETNKADTGEQANVWLSEFRKEINGIPAP